MFRICFGVCPRMIYRRRAATGMSSARLHSIKELAGSGNSPSLSLTHTQYTQYTHIFSLPLFLSLSARIFPIYFPGRARSSRVANNGQAERRTDERAGQSGANGFKLSVCVFGFHLYTGKVSWPEYARCHGLRRHRRLIVRPAM